MPKVVDIEEIKKQIILGSYNVLIRKGFYNLNIKDISKECGINRTTIYYYFKSKEEIFEKTIYYIIDKIEADIKNIIQQSNKTPLERIKHLNYLWEKEFKNTNIILILMDLWLSIKREESEMFDRIKERISEISNLINKCSLHSIKMKRNEVKGKLDIENSFIILSMLQQMPLRSNLVKDNILSLISVL